MVVFTLRDVMRKASMRLDLRTDDDVSEISCVAREYWGTGHFLLRNGYSLINDGSSVGDCISNGDTVDLIPDPDAMMRGI